MIAVDNLYFSYSQQVDAVYDNVSFTLPETGFFFVSGPTGCGKTTLLNLLRGQLSPQGGEIQFQGVRYSLLKEDEKQAFFDENFAFVSQDFELLERPTVYDNLRFVTEDQERIGQVLQKFGLTEAKNRKVKFLSTGERQRLAIARSFLLEKKVLLCDEITSNLDKANRKSILEILAEISKECLVIAVSHQQKEYLSLCDGVIRIRNGAIETELLRQPIQQEREKLPLNRKIPFLRFFRAYWLTVVENSLIYFLVLCLFFGVMIGGLLSPDYRIQKSAEGNFSNYSNALLVERGRHSFLHGRVYDDAYAYQNAIRWVRDGFIFSDPSLQDSVCAYFYVNPVRYRPVFVGRERKEKDEATIGIWSDRTEDSKKVLSDLLGSTITYQPTNETFTLTGFYQIEDPLKCELNFAYPDTQMRWVLPYCLRDFRIQRENYWYFGVPVSIVPTEEQEADIVAPFRCDYVFFDEGTWDLRGYSFSEDPTITTSEIRIRKDVLNELWNSRTIAFYNSEFWLETDLFFSSDTVFLGRSDVVQSTLQNAQFVALIWVLFFDGTFGILLGALLLLKRLIDRSYENDLKTLSKIRYKKEEIRKVKIFLKGISFAFAVLVSYVLIAILRHWVYFSLKNLCVSFLFSVCLTVVAECIFRKIRGERWYD